MQRVLQRYRTDCGVAALSMVLDIPYDLTEILIRPSPSYGISRNEMVCFLDKRGYEFTIQRAPVRFWRPSPFARAHLLLVSPNEIPQERLKNDVTDNSNPRFAYHWVAMDEDGRIYDPSERDVISIEAYPTILAAIGLL